MKKKLGHTVHDELPVHEIWVPNGQSSSALHESSVSASGPPATTAGAPAEASLVSISAAATGSTTRQQTRSASRCVLTDILSLLS
jgi:hypothetical protein